jgi:hypothetical protein
MVLRELIILATLVVFVPSIVPSMSMDRPEAAHTVKKKKKKVTKEWSSRWGRRTSAGPGPRAGWDP